MFERRSAGIEIGFTQLRAVLTHPTGRRVKFTVATQPLPEGTITPEGVSLPLLTEGLRALRTQMPALRGPVWVSLPEQLMIFRPIRMPRMESGAVAQTLRLQADQYLPFPEAERLASFAVVPGSPGTEEIAVLLAGVHRAVAAAVRQACRAAGLKLAGLTAPVVALAPVAVAWTEGAPLGEPAAVVLAADGLVRAFLFRGPVPLVGRSLSSRMTDGATVHFELRQTLTGQGRMPAQVLILGDVPDGWADALSATLGRVSFGQSAAPVSVLAAPPLPGGLMGAYAVAFGLTMLAEQEEPLLNLMNAKLSLTAPGPWRMPSLVAGSAAVLAGLFGLFGYVESGQLAQELAVARAMQVEPLPMPAELARVDRYGPALAEQSKARSWAGLIDALIAQQPAGLRIRTLAPVPGEGLGFQLSGTAGSYAQIDQFVQNLRGAGYLRAETRTVQRIGAGFLFDLSLRAAGGDGR